MGEHTKQSEQHSMLKQTFAFIVIYFMVMTVIPYLLFHNAPFALFLTYFSNVDIVSNILAINYPSVFDKVYDISPDTFLTYISYNIISLVALSGIFVHGLESKYHEKYDVDIFVSMVIMSIVTWTLPTAGIPYITKKIMSFVKQHKLTSTLNDKDLELFISTAVSVGFIILEGVVIHYCVIHKNTRKYGHHLK